MHELYRETESLNNDFDRFVIALLRNTCVLNSSFWSLWSKNDQTANLSAEPKSKFKHNRAELM